MSSKTRVEPKETRESKKAQFTGPARNKRGSKKVVIVALIAVIGLAAYLATRGSSDKPASSTVTSTTQNASAAGGGDIRVALSDIESGKAKFFDYKSSDNRPVRFFVVKSGDGQYRAALDACDVCFQAKKGYKQEGDNMICQKCGLPFEISRIGEVAGGCNPVGIPRTVEGNNLVIKASELESRKSYF